MTSTKAGLSSNVINSKVLSRLQKDSRCHLWLITSKVRVTHRLHCAGPFCCRANSLGCACSMRPEQEIGHHLFIDQHGNHFRGQFPTQHQSGQPS